MGWRLVKSLRRLKTRIKSTSDPDSRDLRRTDNPTRNQTQNRIRNTLKGARNQTTERIRNTLKRHEDEQRVKPNFSFAYSFGEGEKKTQARLVKLKGEIRSLERESESLR